MNTDTTMSYKVLSMIGNISRGQGIKNIILITEMYDDIRKDMFDYIAAPNTPIYAKEFYESLGIDSHDLKPHLFFMKAKTKFIIFKGRDENMMEATSETIKLFIQ